MGQKWRINLDKFSHYMCVLVLRPELFPWLKNREPKILILKQKSVSDFIFLFQIFFAPSPVPNP